MILENRDPEKIITDRVGIRFNEIITEPKSLQIHTLCWYGSTVCYDRWRIFVYQCLGCCTFPCIASSVGYSMGTLLFFAIWVLKPASRLLEKNIKFMEMLITSHLRGSMWFVSRGFKKLKSLRAKDKVTVDRQKAKIGSDDNDWKAKVVTHADDGSSNV